MADFVLVDDIYGELPLDYDNGILVEQFEPGVPDVREEITLRPDQHGFRDETSLFGARVLTISGKLIANGTYTRQQVRDRLMRYLLPDKRIAVRWTRDGETRQTVARHDKASTKFLHVVDDFNITLKCDPYWTPLTQKQYTIPYSAATSAAGDPWPWLGTGASADIDFEDTYLGSQEVENDGSIPTRMISTFYGPLTGAAIYNVTTDKQFKFESDLVIPAGQVVTVDFDAHTAIMNGYTNVFPYIDFLNSEWWEIEPGVNTLTLQSDYAPGTNPFAVVSFTEKFI